MGAVLCNTKTHKFESGTATRYIGEGATVSLNTLGIQYYFYSNYAYSMWHDWSSYNTSVATVVSETGTVTGVSPGTTTISVYVCDDDSGEEFDLSYTLVVLDNVYDYVVNIEEGQTKTTAQLGLTDFIDQANPSGPALTWHSSDTSIVQITNTSTGTVCGVSCGEVTITATASGRTVLAYTLRSSSYATLLVTSGNGFSICSFAGYTEGDVNVKDTLSKINSNIINIEHKSFSKEEVLTYLKCTSVFYIIAHGLPNAIDVGGDVYLTSDDLIGVDLSNLELVFLLSCNTAKGGYDQDRVDNNSPQNFVERLVCCGAKTVVGFTQTVSADQFDDVSEAFTTLLYEGKSVSEAIDALDGNLSEGELPELICDITQYAQIGGEKGTTIN